MSRLHADAATPLVTPEGSRGEQAYRFIRSAIRAGALPPGARLREAELAKQLGLSRTPVREALSRLESDGLVTTDSGRGLMVAELDHSMVNELYFMREVLECAAARLAARHASDVEIATLREIADRDAALLGQAQQLAANNRFFHDMLYRCAHNRYLLKNLNALHESLALLGPTTLLTPGRPESSARQHQALVEALEQRDPERAEQVIREHIREAHKLRLARMLQLGED